MRETVKDILEEAGLIEACKGKVVKSVLPEGRNGMSGLTIVFEDGSKLIHTQTTGNDRRSTVKRPSNDRRQSRAE